MAHTVITSTTCPKCAHFETLDRNEHEYTLEVNFQGAKHLDTLLRKTFGPDLLEAKRCAGCKKSSNTMKYSRLATVPDLLVIHLPRFRRSETGRCVKNTSPVPFRQDLDLAGFADGRVTLRYRLLSVIHHSGNLEFGHYKNVSRGPSGQWEELDDEVVRITKADAALEPAGNFTPMMLFYARVHDSGPTETDLRSTQNNVSSTQQVRDKQRTKSSRRKARGRSKGKGANGYC